jgi:predicted kinase
VEPTVTGSGRPVVHLLCGFVGSGKTTYARELERSGVVRLSIDELVFDRHGRHGVDYAEHDYPVLSAEAADELDGRLVELLAAGTSVALDYGLWSKEDREHCEALAEANGATWRLVYFKAGPGVLRRRLRERNARSDHDANALRVGPRHFDEFLTRFHPPAGEGEEIREQTSLD